MTKILNLKKPRNQTVRDKFTLQAKESYTELMCRILGEYWQVRNSILALDYDTTIEKVEKLMDEMGIWLVPIRNKAQEIRNRKYRRKNTKVIRLKK